MLVWTLGAVSSGCYLFWGINAEFQAGQTSCAPDEEAAFVVFAAFIGGVVLLMLVRVLRLPFQNPRQALMPSERVRGDAIGVPEDLGAPDGSGAPPGSLLPRSARRGAHAPPRRVPVHLPPR